MISLFREGTTLRIYNCMQIYILFPMWLSLKKKEEHAYRDKNIIINY
jgi:hypothetical protein